MASRSSGVIARFTGGPTMEFMRGRLTRIFGASRLEMSTIEIVSFPGGPKTTCSASLKLYLSSFPMIISCALAAYGNAENTRTSRKPGVEPGGSWVFAGEVGWAKLARGGFGVKAG